MHNQPYFLFLLRQTMSGIICPGAVLLVLCAGALIKNYRLNRTPFRPAHLTILIPLVVPFTLLLWGTWFEHTTPGQTSRAPGWQTTMMDILVLVQFIFHAWCFWRFKGIRLSVGAFSLLEGILTLVALFIASMSVGGTWV